MLKIDCHTHILPKKLPNWADKFGYGDFIYLQHHKKGFAKMMRGNQFFREIKENAWNPELLFGGEFKHKFNPTHSISGKVDYYPTVTDFGDYRLNSQASWEIALSAAWGMSLKLSVIDRYDSTPQGASPNDLDYSTLILWTF